jgi:hypothetical protein
MGAGFERAYGHGECPAFSMIFLVFASARNRALCFLCVSNSLKQHSTKGVFSAIKIPWHVKGSATIFLMITGDLMSSDSSWILLARL